jgi:two-component system alkaline phosphatase synthesis response regulator PhoP
MDLPSTLRDRPLILIVDDEEDILDLVKYNLKKENYDTVEATNGRQALELARETQPDLIILDIMMPEMDGLATAEAIRKDANLRTTPILMLTAKESEADHVGGLESGADIYLTKPISIPILKSQVKALLRGSSRFSGPSDILIVGDLMIDKDKYEAFIKGADAPVKLARKEFDLLYFLASRPGKVYSRQDLLDRVWGHDVYVVDRTVDVHIRKIREKIGDHYIETVKGVGYKLTSRFDGPPS